MSRSRLLLAAVASFVAFALMWFAWESLGSSPARGDTWSSSQLLARADEGQVQSVAIRGSDAVATGKDGLQHDVRLPSTGTDSLQQRLYRDNVSFSFQASSGWAGFVGGVLPGFLLVLLGAAVGVAVSWLAWGRRRHPTPPAGPRRGF
jgi:hypothetical protein